MTVEIPVKKTRQSDFFCLRAFVSDGSAQAWIELIYIYQKHGPLVNEERFLSTASWRIKSLTAQLLFHKNFRPQNLEKHIKNCVPSDKLVWECNSDISIWPATYFFILLFEIEIL